MFGSTTVLVWVLVFSGHAFGYFKTKEACVSSIQHVTFVKASSGETWEHAVEGFCIAVEHPLNTNGAD